MRAIVHRETAGASVHGESCVRLGRLVRRLGLHPAFDFRAVPRSRPHPVLAGFGPQEGNAGAAELHESGTRLGRNRRGEDHLGPEERRLGVLAELPSQFVLAARPRENPGENGGQRSARRFQALAHFQPHSQVPHPHSPDRHQNHQRASQGHQGQSQGPVQRSQGGRLSRLQKTQRISKTAFQSRLLPRHYLGEEKVRTYWLEYCL